jgi:RNA polymerase sigma factor (TIGR02999 family)
MAKTGNGDLQLGPRVSTVDAVEVDVDFRVLYDELRRIAKRQIARLTPGQTISPTALVHEAYVKLVEHSTFVRDEQHFRALAARAMRQIIVDYVRSRGAQKRSAGLGPIESLRDGVNDAATSEEDLLALNEALNRLEQLDSRQARIVELRFFGGLDVDEAAQILSISERTVKREWQKARAFLYDALRTG